MNDTVKPCKMSFPGQCWLGIFLGNQKSQTFFNKVSIFKKERGCISWIYFASLGILCVKNAGCRGNKITGNHAILYALKESNGYEWINQSINQ